MHFKICSYLKMISLGILFLHPTLFCDLEKKMKRFDHEATGISFNQINFFLLEKILMYISEPNLSVFYTSYILVHFIEVTVYVRWSKKIDFI